LRDCDPSRRRRTPEKHRVRSAEYAAKIIIGKSSNMDEEEIDAQLNESERVLKEAGERAFKSARNE